MTTRRRGGRRAGVQAPRVVLDKNVVLSALVFTRGTTAQLRAAWQAGRCAPIVSTATAQQLVRMLAYPKFRLDPAEQEELLADHRPFAQVVAIPSPLPAVPDSRDAFDLPFLHLAAADKAAALVTCDADLPCLGRIGRCAIITPDARLSGRLMPAPSGE